jgi:hypothetical protein
MKKLSLALFLALAAAVLWPAASFALTPRVLEPLGSAPPRAVHMGYSLPAGLRAAVAPAFAPRRASERSMAVRATTGPCTVTGHVFDFAGNPLAGAEVDLWYSDTGGLWVLTDATGMFTFTSVPEAASGELVVWPDSSGNTAFYSVNDTFTAAGPNDFTLRPGMTGAEVDEGTDDYWLGWQSFRLQTMGSGGGGIATNAGDSSEGYVDGSGYVMAPDYDYGVAYPWDDQGIEWFGSALPVTAGAYDGHTMVFDQDNGRGAWIGAPYWESGKAGTVVTLVLENWPSGYQMAFYGKSEAPKAKEKNWGFYVQSDGSYDVAVKLGIPTTATPGYDYELHTWRYDTTTPASLLDLTSYFQVASLKASRSTVKHGGTVRLSGVVPTQGHMGSTAGKSKSVILYQRTSAAGPPTAWNAAAKGWHKVATLKANGLGKYASRLLHPKRTTWYVVRYPGDTWYYPGYTSVLKVAVK